METVIATELLVSSSAFNNDSIIPVKYTCEGEQVSPPLEIGNIPASAKTLAVIAEDPDAPKGIFDHWLVWNLPVNQPIEENSQAGVSGLNGAGKTGYHGPCPPSGYHRYFFYVFALDKELDIATGAKKEALQKAMDGHIVARGQIMGQYQKIHP